MKKSNIQNRQIPDEQMEINTVFHSVGELDQLREIACGASLDITQLTPGTMKGLIANADLGASSIHLNSFSLPARGRGSVSNERWTFVIFPADIEGCFNSQSLASDILLVYPPGTEFEGTISRYFKDWVFTVNHKDLIQTSEKLYQQQLLEFHSGFNTLKPNPQHLKRLRFFASNTLSIIEKNPGLLTDDQSRNLLHVQLLEILSQTIHSAIEQPKRQNKQHHSHQSIVLKAEEFLKSNLSTAITISDLCAETNVSERTLRNAFLNIIGISPNAYIKSIRLNRVRSDLEKPGADSITTVAMRWGFYHLGNFSKDYKNFFGELPSETLVNPGDK